MPCLWEPRRDLTVQNLTLNGVSKWGINRLLYLEVGFGGGMIRLDQQIGAP